MRHGGLGLVIFEVSTIPGTQQPCLCPRISTNYTGGPVSLAISSSVAHAAVPDFSALPPVPVGANRHLAVSGPVFDAVGISAVVHRVREPVHVVRHEQTGAVGLAIAGETAPR